MHLRSSVRARFLARSTSASSPKTSGMSARILRSSPSKASCEGARIGSSNRTNNNNNHNNNNNKNTTTTTNNNNNNNSNNNNNTTTTTTNNNNNNNNHTLGNINNTSIHSSIILLFVDFVLSTRLITIGMSPLGTLCLPCHGRHWKEQSWSLIGGHSHCSPGAIGWGTPTPTKKIHPCQYEPKFSWSGLDSMHHCKMTPPFDPLVLHYL